MNILVTGGLGVVGRPLVQRLIRHNHHVRVIDRAVENAPAGAETIVGDITEFTAAREAVRDMQAVIHLAAIPHPAGASGEEIFRINCSGTFNIYEAAAQEGIRRVVSASSINALGFNYGIKSFPIQYLPIDEEHPTFTTDPYSFSKDITEEIGAYYWRREGISGVQLRLPGVIPMTEEFRRMVQQYAPMIRMASAKMLEMTEADRRSRALQIVAEIDEERILRLQEKPHSFEMSEDDWQPNLDDPLSLVAFGVTDFWAVITADNSAQAFELGVSAAYEGSHPLFVADAANMVGLQAELLASSFYPGAARKRPLIGTEPLVSFDKARQIIGYQPESSMDEWLQAA
jgi:hypothetical protein